MYRLGRGDIDQLVRKPETGMGYQLVEANVNGHQNTFFVFNCELLVAIEELREVGYFLERQVDEIELARSFEFIQLLPLSALPAPTGGPSTPSAPLAPSPRIVRKTVDFEGFRRSSQLFQTTIE